ncbi:hypothetical protein ACIBBG_16435 [Micromonospora chersina]|uniref:hypothetical protein n=1 Tax=Micromonospora chersina TaxID=47854 RepID=UPI0037B922FC
MEKVPPVPDGKRIRRRRVEIAIMTVSAVGVLAAATYVTADAATGNPSAGQVAVVAWLGAMSAGAVIGAVVGVAGCLAEIRRARR